MRGEGVRGEGVAGNVRYKLRSPTAVKEGNYTSVRKLRNYYIMYIVAYLGSEIISRAIVINIAYYDKRNVLYPVLY